MAVMGSMLEVRVQKKVAEVNAQILSRATRTANALRNAELQVLSNAGGRGGKVYRKPNTKRATWTASAPGEPPALRSGTLRRSWRPVVTGSASGRGAMIVARLITGTKYAPYLEDGTENKDGTQKMAARPFVNKIIETAKPEIMQIYSAPYS